MRESTGKRKTIIIVLAVLLLLVLAVAAMLGSSKYSFIGGRVLSKDSQEIDLKGERINVSRLLRFTDPKSINVEETGITADDYERLHERYPDCSITWCVPLSCGDFSSKSESITISSIKKEDLPLFAYFNGLKEIHADGISEWELLSELGKQYKDIDIHFDVDLNGNYYSSDTKSLSLNGPVNFSELNEKIGGFSQLERISFSEDGLSADEMLSLQETYPDISFDFTMEELGLSISSSTERLDFSNTGDVDIDRLVEIAPLFKNVETIDFTGYRGSNEEIYKVIKAFPDADVIWQLEIYGKEVSTLDEEIDFSGIQISDTSDIETAIPLMKNLRKVVMCKCGINDEKMDALNKKYDDVRFVWTVFLGTPKRGNPGYELRTDTTYFISSLQLGEEYAYRLFDDTAAPLKYCTDIVALDLGHNEITKCEFCRYMPNLRFFIAAGTNLNDISPLADCKELYFLEVMFSSVHDLSPLLECKQLRHLNICACPTAESLDILAQMTWLERCYMAGRSNYDNSKQYAYVSSDEFLPDTEKWLLGLEDFYGPWRTHPSYFEMRDALGGAYYMARKPESWP
ncbi:MAG: hypothetical protein IJH53_09355 [Oscillospiraceae bacterium]|nr:hypothetical protein [Oscillospiraceae bacterium]